MGLNLDYSGLTPIFDIIKQQKKKGIMKISFKVKESLSEIEREICNSHKWVTKKINSFSYELIDNISGTEMFAMVTIGEDTIVFKTATSGFEYDLHNTVTGVEVKYKGAYRGLLMQLLMPKLTPVNLLGARVYSSLTGDYPVSLLYYMEIQERFHQFRSKNGLNYSSDPHPDCVTNAYLDYLAEQ